jgi:phospholipase/lecithinase/hemolysin
MRASRGGTPKSVRSADLHRLRVLDNVHPTTQVLQILGNSIYAAAVPEPTTATLLALGLVVIGARRRQRIH